ncbi:MAG: hypothetical protein SNJ59_11815 [Aggregatilineales bacterium]
MSGRYRHPAANPLYRLVQALTLTGLTALCAAGYLGLRALAWGRTAELGPSLVSGAALGALLGFPFALLYALAGRGVRFDWMAAQFGALLGAGLYSAYVVLLPAPGAAHDPAWRAVQGAVDGIVIGALAGAGAGFLNGAPVRLNWRGFLRFGYRFILVICIAGLALIAARLGGIFTAAALAGAVILLLLARWVLGRGAVDEADELAAEQMHDEFIEEDHF